MSIEENPNIMPDIDLSKARNLEALKLEAELEKKAKVKKIFAELCLKYSDALIRVKSEKKNFDYYLGTYFDLAEEIVNFMEEE